LAVDVGSTTFQFPYKPKADEHWKFMEQSKAESKAYLDKGENVPYFFFIEGDYPGIYTGRQPGWKFIELGMPSDLGIQPETGSRQSIFGNLFYSWLMIHFKKPGVFPDSFSRDYFYLNNFRSVVLYGGRHALDTAWMRDIGDDKGLVEADFRHHTPIVASSTVEPYAWKNEDDASELGRLYLNMGLDYEHATAAKIFVQPGMAADSLPITGRPVLNLLDYHVYPKKYSYHIRLNQPAYVRLSASYYSFLNARIDGQKTPFYPGANYEVVLKVPAGEHTIEVEGGWDPYRKAWLYITWMALAILVLLVIRFPAGFDRKKAG